MGDGAPTSLGIVPIHGVGPVRLMVGSPAASIDLSVTACVALWRRQRQLRGDGQSDDRVRLQVFDDVVVTARQDDAESILISQLAQVVADRLGNTTV